MEVWYAAVATVVAVFGVTFTLCSKTEKKVGTVFKRFDEYKQHIEETHVSKEVCGILHNQIVEDVVEIKSDVKQLLIMVKNGK